MIKKANIQWPTKTLLNQVNKGNVNFDCAIQRGYTWDIVRKSLLIHSMIEGYPVPALYFAKREDGKYDGLDGKQRSNAMMGFVNGEYALCDNFDTVLDDEGEEHDFSGHYFGELPAWAQDAIKDFSLTIYYFEDLTDEQYDNLFFRLNNGKPLTAIELTRVKAKSLQKFQELTKHELVELAVTDKGKARYQHENLVMQAWALCFATDDDFSFETKVFRRIIEAAEVTPEQVDVLTKCFDIILGIYNFLDLTDRAEKKIAKKLTTRTHLVALTKVVMAAVDTDTSVDLLAGWVRMFFGDGRSSSVDVEYNAACGAGSARRDKIVARMGAIESHFARYVRIDRNPPALPQEEEDDTPEEPEEIDTEYTDEENE